MKPTADSSSAAIVSLAVPAMPAPPPPSAPSIDNLTTILQPLGDLLDAVFYSKGLTVLRSTLESDSPNTARWDFDNFGDSALPVRVLANLLASNSLRCSGLLPIHPNWNSVLWPINFHMERYVYSASSLLSWNYLIATCDEDFDREAARNQVRILLQVFENPDNLLDLTEDQGRRIWPDGNWDPSERDSEQGEETP